MYEQPGSLASENAQLKSKNAELENGLALVKAKDAEQQKLVENLQLRLAALEQKVK